MSANAAPGMACLEKRVYWISRDDAFDVHIRIARVTVSAGSFFNRLFRRTPKRPALEDIELMASDRLRALYASDPCRDDSTLLVAVWRELRFREMGLQALSQPTISVRRPGDRD